MFRRLGRGINRFWPLLVVVWFAGLLISEWQAPSWNEVAVGGVYQFLPGDVASRRAEQRLQRAFPDDRAKSTMVILAHRDDEPLRDADKAFVRETVVPALRQLDRPSNQQRLEDENSDGFLSSSVQIGQPLPKIVRIRSLADEMIGRLLISPDQRATIVIVELAAGFLDRSQCVLVDAVRDRIAEWDQSGVVPEGLHLDLTGSAVVGCAINREEFRSAQIIRRWTIWWVLALLLLVHRAPLLALIQMVTVFCAMRLSINLLALMGRAGWIELFEGLDVYTTVLVYGAGIDYSLFLLSRYREHVEQGTTTGPSSVQAIDRVGLAVLASALTEIVAIGMLNTTEFAMFQRAGVTIPFGLVVMLLASLTFGPALLPICGRWAIWPSRANGAGQGSTTKRRSWFRRGLRLLLGLDSISGVWQSIGDQIRRRPVWVGAIAVGLLLPSALMGALAHRHLSYAPMDELPEDEPSLVGLRRLQQFFPPGVAGPITVVVQTERLDFRTEAGRKAVERLTDRLWERRESLGLADLRSLSEPLGHSEAARSLLSEDPGPLLGPLVRKRAIERYVTGDDALNGGVTRLVLIPRFDPFSSEALERVDAIERTIRAVRPESLAGAQIAMTGEPVSERDLRDVAQRDRRQIYLLATLGVLLVLIILLRRWAISVFLILTVLVSYLTTLGLTALVFRAVWSGPGPFPGLDWTVPTFLFTLLIAVGEDYNIFLITRIDEEQQDHGPVDGVVRGLVRTGGIISGCGLIMAGTFAALVWGGTLSSLVQLGFALALGVLLDTFVVRPLLVPAWLVLIESGRLGRLGKWLGGRSQPERAGQDDG